MKFVEHNGQKIAILSLDTLVIGSGCAGFNAADTLYDLGRRQIAILTEGVRMGTSRNTGSDKQTYYKLSLCSDAQDSIYLLAKNLFDGGSVNGDTALAEAAGSLRSFMKLVNLGVPFPTNRYGEYVGYKTDHDPYRRATSCGPLTSKMMTEKLEASVNRKQIPIYDRIQAVRLITEDNHIKGVLAIDLNRLSESDWGMTVFLCNQVILATGGPAIVYQASVYPESQTGMTGMALEAGAAGCNLQEWQYGLASVGFRWNVSGSYQQVLPRYIAVDRDGHEREFLPEYFETPQQALDMVFLKGYQWPFDTSKIVGSSIIDLIVHHEVVDKGNRVYLDFRTDPIGLENGFDRLGEEARYYLQRSGALLKTPIARLAQMNQKAIDLYASHGIDLYHQPLEIAVCAQHNNGGLAIDLDWQTTVKGLYAAGEVAGTFGIARPGGSALNSTQVGSQRAAEHIADTTPDSRPAEEWSGAVRTGTIELLEQMRQLLDGGEQPVVSQRTAFQREMTCQAAEIRSRDGIEQTGQKVMDTLAGFYRETKAASPLELPFAFKNRDMLVVQQAMLSAMLCTGPACGSRGSALMLSENGSDISFVGLTGREELSAYRYCPGNGTHRGDWVRTIWTEGQCTSGFVPVRPLPKTDDWFETVWNEYLQYTAHRQ